MPRARSNTAHSYNERYSAYEEPEAEPVRAPIRSQARVSSTSRINTHLSTHGEYPEMDSPQRPSMGRSTTFQGPASIHRELTPVSDSRRSAYPSDASTLRGQLRPGNRIQTGGEFFCDPSDDSTLNSSSPDRSYGARSVSPATSHGSVPSRTASYSTLTNVPNGRKAPPPPPPSRAKKPPPPPPVKRANISSTSVNRY